MSHLLHAYVAQQLSERIARYRVVVWYDPRSEFADFVSELGGTPVADGVLECRVDGIDCALATHDGSMYSARVRIEPMVGADEPQPVVLYLAGVSRDLEGSVLMELELAGCRWEPKLRQLARNALRQRYTDGVIDELLGRERLTYEDIANALTEGGEAAPSMLRQVVTGATAEAQIARWLAEPDLDAAVVEKQAESELRVLIRTRLGVEVPEGELSKWRAVVSRFVLGVEFRSDLRSEPPPELAQLGAVASGTEATARTIAGLIRSGFAVAYPALADQVESELGLRPASIDALDLGAIDTFRFEEAALLRRCGELIVDGSFDRVLEIAAERSDSFWVLQSIDRRAHWEAMRLAAELGAQAAAVGHALVRPPTSPDAYITMYASSWFELDRAQRRFEALLARLEEEPDERAVVAVRQRYDAVINKMAEAFVSELQRTGWSLERVLHQTSIYDNVVRRLPGRVAYFLVDALRYEMGEELAERLSGAVEVSVQPAVAVLPSITPMGMAALMPGASRSYDVVDVDGTLMARIDGTALPDLKARKKYFAAVVPSSIDLELGEVLGLTRARLEKKVGPADCVVVRSQEVDFFGEARFEARDIMDNVINNLARAVRKLGAIGIDTAVVTADHGHLYSWEERDASMRIDAPGGETIDLHRRCWIGRGGATPGSCVRVRARSLGSDSDLDYVFPVGVGVFRSGGDLAYHHGGPSLEEIVVPVVTIRSLGPTGDLPAAATVAVVDIPTAITNRIFSVRLSSASMMTEALTVQPVLVDGGVQVGAVGMAVGAELDRSAGTVALPPGSEITVGFVLEKDDATSVMIVVLDPRTDAELYRSPAVIPVRLGVG